MAQAKDGTTTQVSCRVPKETAEALARMATDQERSLSWIVSKILQNYVFESKAKVPK